MKVAGTKLALGTAQFGLPYGIANATGQIAPAEGDAILRHAASAGIALLDTAMAYGDSEARLGAAGLQGWSVVSKLPAIPAECSDVERWMRTSVEDALRRLRIPRLYGLLLHRPAQLDSPRGPAIHRALTRLRRDGWVQRIGVSVYAPAEARAIQQRFPLDLVQVPLNVFDRRLLADDTLAFLAGQEVEVHARSVFLQGLLLMPPDQRPPMFDPWRPLWERWDAWLADAQLRPLDVCLRFVLAQEVQRVVVGVDSVRQLQQIIEAAAGELPPIPPDIACGDAALIDPSSWSAP